MQRKAPKNVAPPPLYWWLLNSSDLHQYTCLRIALTSSETKNQRNKRIATFTEAVEAVRAFAVRGDMYDKVRCLVCGIAWLPEGIAINTHQLKLLISRCKSSINGSLQKLGFTENLGRTAAANAIIAAYPFLKENQSELRKWSVRRRPTNPQSAQTHTHKHTKQNKMQQTQQQMPVQNPPQNQFIPPQFTQQMPIPSNSFAPTQPSQYIQASQHNQQNVQSLFPQAQSMPQIAIQQQQQQPQQSQQQQQQQQMYRQMFQQPTIQQQKQQLPVVVEEKHDLPSFAPDHNIINQKEWDIDMQEPFWIP